MLVPQFPLLIVAKVRRELWPSLFFFMGSVAKYPREKRQRKEPDDSSESEPREDSKDLYGDVKEIEDSVPGFLEPGNLESGLRLP